MSKEDPNKFSKVDMLKLTGEIKQLNNVVKLQSFQFGLLVKQKAKLLFIKLFLSSVIPLKSVSIPNNFSRAPS